MMHMPPLHDVIPQGIVLCLIIGVVLGWVWRPRWAEPGMITIRKFLERVFTTIPLLIYISRLIAEDRKKSGDK